MSQAVDSFADTPGAADCQAETIENELHITSELGSNATSQKRSSRGGAIPQETARMCRGLLRIVVTNLMRCCIRISKNEAAASSVDVESELSFQATGLER